MLNTPVWEGGLKVTVKQGPNRVISSVSTSHASIEVEMPSEEAVERYKRIFRAPTSSERDARPGKSPGRTSRTRSRAGDGPYQTRAAEQAR